MKRPDFRFYSNDWHGSKWVCFDGDAIFPRKPACYVIYFDDVLSYIGQTEDLAKRLSMHGLRVAYGNRYVTKWGVFNSVKVKVRFGDKMGDWAMREIRLINRLKPAMNWVGGNKKRGAA